MSDAAAEGELVAAGGPAVPQPGRGLRQVLLESRHRWRDLATMGCDLAFETDALDRFVFLYPEEPLGWNATTLLGQPADLLLAEPGGAGVNPFRPTVAGRHRRAWLRAADGGLRCLSFATAPLLDEAGQIIGARGTAQDMTEQDGLDAGVAAALRRAELIDHILWRMRHEVLAPRMMQAALEALMTALGADGCILVDLLGDGAHASTLHQIGAPPPQVLHTALTLLEGCDGETALGPASDGRQVLVCPCQSRFGEQAGLALWRLPGGRGWDADDHRLASAAIAIVRMILEHESIQREMSRQARTDPLTGLLNRRAFMDEIGRRADRLERDGRPGTLMFVDLDQFKALNDSAGHDIGDEALIVVASLLRATVRPADLIARLGGDEFALWLDGADELAAAERAEHLRVEAPKALAEVAAGTGITLGMSIGIATRWPGRGDALETIITRADRAMYHVKRNGRGHWQVWRPELGA